MSQKKPLPENNTPDFNPDETMQIEVNTVGHGHSSNGEQGEKPKNQEVTLTNNKYERKYDAHGKLIKQNRKGEKEHVEVRKAKASPTELESEDDDEKTFYLCVEGMENCEEKRFFNVQTAIAFGCGEHSHIVVNDPDGVLRHCKVYLMNNYLVLMSQHQMRGITVGERDISAGKLWVLDTSSKISLGGVMISVTKTRPLILEEPRKVDHAYRKKVTEAEAVKKNKTLSEQLAEFWSFLCREGIRLLKKFSYANLEGKGIEIVSRKFRFLLFSIDVMICFWADFFLRSLNSYNLVCTDIIHAITEGYGFLLDQWFSSNSIIFFFLERFLEAFPITTYLFWTLLGALLYGVSIPAYLLRVRVLNDPITQRILPPLKAIFGAVTLPFFVLEIPLIMGLPTIKEMIFRSCLVTLPSLEMMRLRKLRRHKSKDNKDKDIDTTYVDIVLESVHGEAKKLSFRDRIAEALSALFEKIIAKIKAILEKSALYRRLVRWIRILLMLPERDLATGLPIYLIPRWRRRSCAFAIDLAIIFAFTHLLGDFFPIVNEWDRLLFAKMLYAYQYVLSATGISGDIVFIYMNMSFSLLEKISFLLAIFFLLMIPLLLGSTLGQFILQIDGPMRGGIGRVTTCIRCSLGLVLLPLAPLDLTMAIGIPSMKEIFSRSLLICQNEELLGVAESRAWAHIVGMNQFLRKKRERLYLKLKQLRQLSPNIIKRLKASSKLFSMVVTCIKEILCVNYGNDYALAGPLRRGVSLAGDLVLAYFISKYLHHLSSAVSELDRVVLAYLAKYSILVKSSEELLSYVSIKDLNFLWDYIAFFYSEFTPTALIFAFVFPITIVGTTFFQYIVGIKPMESFSNAYILGLFRGTISILTLPFVILELPIVLGLPTAKEYVTRSLLLVKTSRS
ncbi:MAG: hypothetical protein HQK50_13320 [Oligoflexia bacterium]|nr:hypothetical protein [Oligoflexia bacterium]MBF0366547.1 hypothetical protein [Oligoflexia bacterium]